MIQKAVNPVSSNPYEVLGINENASDEEVKKAYREMVKKYHPDQYGNNPLSELAEEKIKEINVAYDTIMRQRENRSGNGGSSASYGGGNPDFSQIRSLIRDGQVEAAMQRLEQMPDGERTAEWYYLMGAATERRGWYDQARRYYANAVNLDPGNMEYRNAFNGMYQTAQNYRTQSQGRGYQRGDNCCDFCSTLICADCCCECMGGDLIRCC